MITRVRILNESAFILHSIPYKETSLVLDVFSRSYGRVSMIAKGAKRASSNIRSVLQKFQPLSISWISGNSELKILTQAEWIGGVVPLTGEALLYGFYLNELLIKLTVKEDTNKSLYDFYLKTITYLSNIENLKKLESILIQFAFFLFQETGFISPILDICLNSGESVRAETRYVYQPEVGIRAWDVKDPSNWPVIEGKHLLAMQEGDYNDLKTLIQSKGIIHFLLDYYLPKKNIMTSQIFIDLARL